MGLVTLPESAGIDDRVNPNGGATGLWQLYPGGEQYKNPRTNARAAVAKFKEAKRAGGTGFEPWKSSESVWGGWVNKESGQLTVEGIKQISKFPGLKKGDTGGLFGGNPLGGPIGQPIEDAINKALDPMKAIGEFFVGLTELILTPEGWRRLAKIILGGAILLWALNQLSKSIFDVNPAGGAVKRASRAGTMIATKGAIG